MFKRLFVLALAITLVAFLGCKKEEVEEEVIAEAEESVETSKPAIPMAAEPIIPPAADVTADIVGKTVVVKVKDMNFRTEPDAEAQAVKGKEVLYKGETAEVLAVQGQWYYIRTDEGYLGWVRAEYQGNKYLVPIKG